MSIFDMVILSSFKVSNSLASEAGVNLLYPILSVFISLSSFKILVNLFKIVSLRPVLLTLSSVISLFDFKPGIILLNESPRFIFSNIKLIGLSSNNFRIILEIIDKSCSLYLVISAVSIALEALRWLKLPL